MSHLSPSFIADMKQKLLEQRAMLRRELGLIAQNTPDEEYQAKFADYGRDDESNAQEMADYVASAETTRVAEEQLKATEAALKRIEAGTYGTTDQGETIPEARLRANPAATTLATK